MTMTNSGLNTQTETCKSKVRWHEETVVPIAPAEKLLGMQCQEQKYVNKLPKCANAMNTCQP